MLKTFALVLGLAVVAGCKTDGSSSSASQQSTSGAAPSNTGPKARSGKIDLPQRSPHLPADDDGAANAQQSREERRKQRLAEMDTDGDGEISDEEREAARAKREAEMKARLDTNKDGTVSDEERDAARKQRATTMHDRLDRDGDGKLTAAELADSPMGRMDINADTNGDGVITVDELDAAMKERMQNGRMMGGFRGGRRFRGGGSGAGSDTPPTN